MTQVIWPEVRDAPELMTGAFLRMQIFAIMGGTGMRFGEPPIRGTCSSQHAFLWLFVAANDQRVIKEPGFGRTWRNSHYYQQVTKTAGE